MPKSWGRKHGEFESRFIDCDHHPTLLGVETITHNNTWRPQSITHRYAVFECPPCHKRDIIDIPSNWIVT